MLLCRSSPVLCWRSLITATRCWLSFPQSSWTPGRYQHSSSFGPSCYEGRSHYTWVETFERPIHWLRIQERIQYKLCVNIIWHHPTCPTNFNKSLEWSPYSVWDHRVRQRSSYHLLGGRRCRQGVEQSAVNSHCCVNPAFVPSSPENSSIHRIFPTCDHLSYVICILS